MYHSKTRAFVEVDSFNARNQWEEKIRNKVENENIFLVWMKKSIRTF